MSNVIFKPFLEKLGGTNADYYIGRKGEIFYDPVVGNLRVSDGITPGGVLLTGGGGGGGGGAEWVRPSDWLAMPDVVETEEKFVGLFAVYDTPANFIALYFEGDYTIDWGDGNVENFSSGVTVQHNYNWADIPSNTLTTDGFRQVLITVTPQVGQHLTVMDLSVRHDNYTNLNASTPWLDLKVSMPNADSGSSLRFGYPYGINSDAYLFDVQRIHIVHAGNMSDFSECFYNLASIKSVTIDNCPNADNFYNLFNSCYALTSVSLSDTSKVTNMSGMFAYCYSLTSVSLPDTSSVTDMSGMFYFCFSLTSFSLPDVSKVEDMQAMFNNCQSLTSVSLSDTPKVTSMYGMFLNCLSLISVSLPDTSKVEDMQYMFFYCPTLTSVSLSDTSKVNNMQYMFYICPNLQTVYMPGAVVDIDLSNCLLGTSEIISIFNSLGDAVGKTISVGNNYGTPGLTLADKQIAIDKGWDVGV